MRYPNQRSATIATGRVQQSLALAVLVLPHKRKKVSSHKSSAVLCL